MGKDLADFFDNCLGRFRISLYDFISIGLGVKVKLSCSPLSPVVEHSIYYQGQRKETREVIFCICAVFLILRQNLHIVV